MEAKQEEVTGGPAQSPKVQEIQKRYNQICLAIGDMVIKTELLKAQHVELHNEFQKVMAEEVGAKSN